MLLISGVLLLSVSFGISTKDIHYYNKLWKENVAKSRDWERPTSYAEYKADTGNCEDFGIYDFIIVGGSPSAAVLANRLSEVEEWSILLLELERNPQSDFDLMPGTDTYRAVSQSTLAYVTVKNDFSCLARKDQQCPLDLSKRGPIDDTPYIRGSKRDYDKWAAAGNTNWGYDEVLEYFMKAEKMMIPGMSSDVHANDGMMPVTNANASELLKHVIAGYRAMGYTVLDYNGESQLGVSELQVHVDGGIRMNAHHVYLESILQRKNLKVVMGAFPVHISFIAGLGNAVRSLKFTSGGKCYNVYTSKELILACGAIITPHLLILSGIGPREELSKCKITPIKESPVGYNLIDYSNVEIQFKTNYCAPSTSLTSDFENYVLGIGNLAKPQSQVIAFSNLEAKDPSGTSFMVTYSSPNSYDDFQVLQKLYNFGMDTMNNFLYSLAPNDILAKITFFEPDIPGRLTLSSSDPFDYPIIQPHYQEPLDYRIRSYNKYKHVAELENTDAFRSINAKQVDRGDDSCNIAIKRNLIFCRILTRSGPSGDPMGTCRMGKDEATSVVDQNLMVYGTKKLRIVDASVVPEGLSGRTNSFVIMAAEKMADEIKTTHL